MDRASKLRRLENFRRRLPHVSASALSAILTECTSDKPDVFDRRAIREARDTTVSEDTPYGPILMTVPIECTDGTREDIYVANPFAMLYVAAKHCKGFAWLMHKTHASQPSTYDHPWSFALYSDEVVPGNQLSFNNKRKMWVLYYSFLQFGAAILSMEDAWFGVVAERSDRVKHYKGGIAQVFSAVLRLLFTGDSHTMQHSGLLLDLADGTTMRLFANLTMILQDGGAHKGVFMVKGDGGSKFCMICKNLYSIGSDLAGEDGEELLTCSHVFENELDFATDMDIRNTVRRLAAYKLIDSPNDFKLREQACGFNHNPFNMLLDPSLDDVLKPVSQFAHDWMHTMVVHGVWNTIMFLLIEALIASGIPDASQQLGTYLALWTLPRRSGTSAANMSDAFSKSRWKSSRKAKYFKCTASEAISMYAILACFVTTVFAGAGYCVLECTAYILLADFMDLLVASPHGTVTSDMMRAAGDKFLRACVNAGWRERLIPKFHWIIHLAIESRWFGILLTCWVHERKHRMVKRYTDQVRNTRVYEKSIMSEVICHHIAELSDACKFDLRVRLLEPRNAPKKLVRFLRHELDLTQPEHDDIIYKTSSKARVSEFEVCEVRDVVLACFGGRQLSCCEIWTFADVAGEAIALVSVWVAVAANSAQGTLDVRISDSDVRLVSVADIVVSCTYRRKVNGLATVLIPVLHRDRV
jgi:hypothetical protein